MATIVRSGALYFHYPRWSSACDPRGSSGGKAWLGLSIDWLYREAHPRNTAEGRNENITQGSMISGQRCLRLAHTECLQSCITADTPPPSAPVASGRMQRSACLRGGGGGGGVEAWEAQRRVRRRGRSCGRRASRGLTLV